MIRTIRKCDNCGQIKDTFIDEMGCLCLECNFKLHYPEVEAMIAQEAIDEKKRYEYVEKLGESCFQRN